MMKFLTLTFENKILSKNIDRSGNMRYPSSI